ncbi:DNA mismatch repair endonuclease MutL [Candidatus Dojkabacteria bacterium]|nr:DNA mismatch repair endonuclease MutL [Candidatus Dojkabacteria bacterium]
MNNINKLSPQLVAKIAAGEVVERPASVVKELIENSIDAEAKHIELHIKDAGKSLIEVRDDGSGMSKENALLAFEQHSTSKISQEADLERISTLGFRGEALSSIAAVAEIEMQTGNQNESTSIEIANQEQKSYQGKLTQGTTIKAKDLFRRIPARKKFLRSESTEYRHISDIFIKHALANLKIGFKFFSNGREIYNLPPVANLEMRIFDVWGKRYKDKLITVNFDSPEIKLTGLLTPPEEARRDRNAQYLFLNKRPISSNLITKAVEDAFHSTHPDRRYPGFFLFLELAPASVDVNVHPRKQEVKFGDTRRVYNAVKHASEHALSTNLRNNVKQQLQDQPFPQNSGNTSDLSEKTLSYNHSKAKQSNTKPGVIQGSLSFSRTLLKPKREEDTNKPTSIQTPNEVNDAFESAENGFSYKAIQFFGTYIVIEKQGKLLFIDQHAADERINYERIMKKVSSEEKPETQSLLTPEIVELTSAEFEMLKDKLEDFTKLGIVLEPFGKNTVKLSEKPVVLENFDFKSFIEEVLAEDLVDINKEKVLHGIVSSMACHSSIRAGRPMHRREIGTMIEQLFACDKPYSCPHGRPIIWELTKNELEKNFKRTGF